MLLRIDAQAALPVYEQIREQVTRMAVLGTLPAGSRLPTIRQLAVDLGIAKGTVAKAYALLETTAVVESRGHKGTFVLEPATQGTSIDPAVTLREAAEAYVVAARQSGRTRSDAVAELKAAWDSL